MNSPIEQLSLKEVLALDIQQDTGMPKEHKEMLVSNVLASLEVQGINVDTPGVNLPVGAINVIDVVMNAELVKLGMA